MTDQHTKFIALSQSDGTCTTVPRHVSGVFMATNDGYWLGQQGFQYHNAMYTLTLNNFQGTNSDFTTMMSHFYDKYLYPYGQLSVEANLALNLVVWMGLQVSYLQNGFEQVFSLNGDPLVVFNGQLVGSIGSAKGICRAAVSSTFQPSSYLLSTSYGTAEYSSQCSEILSPRYLNFQYAVSPTFSDTIDIRTFISVIVLNLRILNYQSLETLQLTPNASRQMFYTYENVTYEFNEKYSTRYPNSLPVLCYHRVDELFTDDLPMDDNLGVHPLSNKVFCGLYSGSSNEHLLYGIPLLNAAGGMTVPGAPYCDW